MRHIKSILVLIVTLSFVISPFLTRDFSGFRADQLPIPQIDPPVQPAGYAFAIWGVIYIWLAMSAVYGAIFKRTSADWDAARSALIISLGVGTFWLAIAVRSAEWATVLIWVMLISAIAALIKTPRTDRWVFQVPIALYAGWLTAASSVSLGLLGAGYGFVFNQIGWAYAGLTVATVIAFAVQLTRPDAPEYSLAVVWALIGVIVANMGENIGVQVFAAAAIVILAAVFLWQRIGQRNATS
ncbi:hypothetical protein [Pseudaestuariivita rosea]|uniref:hypothetical protein n=1 Tax=Pseudaestuariivita rosea TaxID=2763263 RepID=UPI001ABB9C0D|nr:hypothetical protein [Pseudaestuariivita rosea]